jgi:3-methyl-2-oxobutanoate hydroxymethyltransferase
MNAFEFREAKAKGQKLTMVTCYDHWSAKIMAESAVDVILVGDSAAMVMHGLSDTIPATIEMLAGHVADVRRGAPKKFIVADLPFLSYRGDLDFNINNVGLLMRAGANAVKLEAFDGNGDFIRHLVQSGIPVMGHTGLTPQFVNAFGGFRVQGRDSEQRKKILSDARELEDAGCFAVVLECIPEDLAAEITSSLRVPTIGIGAGLMCDGQVLVLHDLLGLDPGFKPKFVRRYLNGAELIKGALEQFCSDVREKKFPSSEEVYR